MITRFVTGLVLLLAMFAPGPALAGLTKNDIGKVGANPSIGATLDTQASFATRDGETISLGQAIDGRPAVFVFADLTCTTLCGVTLRAVADALSKVSLRPGRDYSLVVASIDPKDDAADAKAMAKAQLAKAGLARDAVFLLGGGVDALAKTAGYAYSYDAANDAYAHPVGVYLLTPDGKIARYLSGLGFTPRDMELGIGEAGSGETTPIATQLLLLCYSYDPVTGIYTPAINTIMAVSGIVTMLLLAGGVLFFVLRERRAAGTGGRA